MLIGRLMISTAVATGLLTQVSVAERFLATSWLPLSFELSKYPYEEFSERVGEATDGRIEFDVHYNGALIPARETLTGVGDGTAKLGIIFPGYTPAELPLVNTMLDAGFVKDDTLATAFAWTELNFVNDKLKAEWNSHNVVFGGGYTTPTYHLLCRDRVEKVEDVSGRRMRTATAGHVAFVSALGGTPVSVPQGDIYSGIQRGSLDCTLSDPTVLLSSSLNEVVRYITEIPLGLSLGATWVYNSEFWNGVSSEDRRILLDEMALAIVRTQLAYAASVDAANADAEEREIVNLTPSFDFSERLDDFRSTYLADLPTRAVEDRRIDSPNDVLDEFLSLTDKWQRILSDVDRQDEAVLIELLKTNVFNQVDETQYGLK